MLCDNWNEAVQLPCFEPTFRSKSRLSGFYGGQDFYFKQGQIIDPTEQQRAGAFLVHHDAKEFGLQNRGWGNKAYHMTTSSVLQSSTSTCDRLASLISEGFDTFPADKDIVPLLSIQLRTATRRLLPLDVSCNLRRIVANGDTSAAFEGRYRRHG